MRNSAHAEFLRIPLRTNSMRERLETLLGPIFNKEAVEIARRPRFYFSRAFYGAALLVILAIAWQEMRWYRYGTSYHNAMARVAQELFVTASIVQYAAVFLFVPLFLCATIAGEREERTLELLFSTPLKDREIILGKLISRVAAMACLILCGLPVLSFVMFFGGVEPESLWRVLVTTLLAVFYVAAHAIYFSTVTGSTLGALVRTYWWLALWLLGLPLFLVAVLEESNAPRAMILAAMGSLSMVNPVIAFTAVMETQLYNQLRFFIGPWFLPATFVLPLAWSLFLIWRSVRRLRQTPRPILAWVPHTPWLRNVWRWWNRPEAVALRRVSARRFRGRPVENPLWLRARLAPIYDRTGHLGLIQYAGWAVAVFAVLMVVIVEPQDLDDAEVSMVFGGFAWGAVGALAALLAGSAIVGDRRRGFLELVLVTPLTGREISGGVFLAVWEHLRPLAWLPWALGAFFCFTGATPPWGILVSGVTAALFGALLVWHGIACSLAARTTPGALVATFLLPAVVLAGTPLFIGMFEEHHGPALWVVAALFFIGARHWSRRRLTLASTAAYLIAVHLAFTAVATCWTYTGHRDEYPVLAMHPGVLVIATLDDHPERWFRGDGWFVMVLAYWLALVLNITWLQNWLVVHFDELAERTSAGASPGVSACHASQPAGSAADSGDRSGVLSHVNT